MEVQPGQGGQSSGWKVGMEGGGREETELTTSVPVGERQEKRLETGPLLHI